MSIFSMDNGIRGRVDAAYMDEPSCEWELTSLSIYIFFSKLMIIGIFKTFLASFSASFSPIDHKNSEPDHKIIEIILVMLDHTTHSQREKKKRRKNEKKKLNSDILPKCDLGISMYKRFDWESHLSKYGGRTAPKKCFWKVRYGKNFWILRKFFFTPQKGISKAGK